METVYLATFGNDFQAGITQDLLTNAGIEFFLRNENLSSVLNIPAFQIEIYVLEQDYERAKEILKEAFPELV